MAMDAFAIFWGNVLALSMTDVWITTCLSLLSVLFIIIFLRPITAILFDRETARMIGIRDRWIYYLIIFIVGAVIGTAMKLVGVLLLDAILLLPAAAAFIIGRNLRQIFLFSSLFGVVCAFFGLWGSLIFDIPVSSSIAIVGGLAILAAFTIRKLYR